MIFLNNCDNRNAGLNVPPCPRPRRARQWRVVEIGAAACVGLLGGALMPGVDKEPASPLLASADTVVVERIVRDTVVREIPGRLTENSVTAKENPVSRPAEAEAVPVEDMPAEPRTEPVVPPSSRCPACLCRGLRAVCRRFRAQRARR